MELIKRDFADFCGRSGKDTEDFWRIHNQLHCDAWLAGGAVRKTLQGKPVDSDWDYFFQSKGHFDSWKKALPNTLSQIRETQHHVHFKGTLEGSELPVNIQGIFFQYYSSAEEVLNSFDYTISQFLIEDDYLVTTPEALWDLGRNRLVVNRITYPVSSMRRLLKYGSQGFTACGGTMQELYLQTLDNTEALSKLDIEYID